MSKQVGPAVSNQWKCPRLFRYGLTPPILFLSGRAGSANEGRGMTKKNVNFFCLVDLTWLIKINEMMVKDKGAMRLGKNQRARLGVMNSWIFYRWKAKRLSYYAILLT